jgi:16S rRNA (uracil1498-N3)-methyltransferase
MNLVLFAPGELAAPLPLDDPRARHVLAVLRRRPGDTFLAGLVDGPIGQATLVGQEAAGLRLTFTATDEPPPSPPVTLLIGLPRPQTARDLLRDATTLGLAALHFVATERSDPNYATATLWRDREWHRHLLTGAMQAADTRLPAVTWDRDLATALAAAPTATNRIALDNYEAAQPLAAVLPPSDTPLVLALGPERGWGLRDRAALCDGGFTLAHLGTRPLRLETAAVVALGLARHGRV